MDFYRLKILLRMEWMKTWCRPNIVFTLVVFLLVLVQVAFVARIGAGDPHQYSSNIAITFIPLLMLVNVGREFDLFIVQRSLVSGLSRRDYFIGKIIQLGLFALLSFLLAIIFSVLTAALYQLPLTWDVRRLLMYFITAFCLGSFALMIVFFFRKRFFALAVFVIYVLIENSVAAFIPQAIALPFQTCIQLLKHGIYEWPQFSMAAIYTLLFLVSGYQAFARSDLR